MIEREKRLERVARAICTVFGWQSPDELTADGKPHWTLWLEETDAVIFAYEAALKEEGLVVIKRAATGNMLRAGHRAHTGDRGHGGIYFDTKNIYDDMIEAWEKDNAPS